MLKARMKNPGFLIEGAVPAIQALIAATQAAGVDPRVLHLSHLRASQINGCSFCVDIGTKHAKKEGESDERLHAVAGWREAPYFSDAERAALALSEAMTALDMRDPVPDSVWSEAAERFDEKQLAALVLWIGTINMFNRTNIATRQPAGQPLGG
ncbi:AhpD family alkylhydroperoxidase [Bradyrhizobium japonicum]|uniref:carboxymuconolactone decarboxylase family protein n=1 Tax=Bradyrhizobium TaxID=374 RepID=UPI0005763019|nr:MULTISPECIES: carboxymuconolactone decarboxylase family protein [Bradyrhizobium]MBR0948362.1 carboxymuconolactone decarboxylase family protein [Bradyrhizobium liaoningense]MDI2077335.1 carboxymuconolactone decarboxylase family protein [Bradyrhizobium sp. Mp27]